MNFRIIAVDFDGTLCVNNYPDIGEPNEKLIEYLRNVSANGAGAKLILWTCRTGELLQNAIDWCSERLLYFDAVNENLPEIIEWMGGDSRKIYADEYIDDRNFAKFRLPFVKEEGSDMQSWAEREIEIACELENPDRKPGEWDYGCVCYESALKAYNSLIEDDHSVFSIGITKNILNRLIEGKPLTPIEDTDDIWDKCTFCKEYDSYQCKRMSSFFKDVYPDETIKYSDNDRIYCVNVDNPSVYYRNRLARNLIDEMYPITMPYSPESKSFIVHCEEFLTDPKNRDYDTIGILYVIKPNGDRVDINRFFKEGEDDFVEITPYEYEMRRKMHEKHLEEFATANQ